MDWPGVLNTRPEDVEGDKALLENLYSFFSIKELPQSIEEAPSELQEAGELFKVVRVLCNVMREKGLDAQAAEEELRELTAQYESSKLREGSSEHELIEQALQLEKELRARDETIERLKQQVGTTSPSVATRQLRHMKEEIEDLNHELSELKRSLGQERDENQKLMQSASSERLKARQLEREMDKLRHNLDDYRKQLDWQREQGGVASRATVEADCRERLRKKDLEMAQQLDKIEELLNARDSLEQQLREMTLQLGRVEEQRLVALKDNETMKSALVESDCRCDELEAKSKLLEGKVADLQEQLAQQTVADDHIVSLVHSRAQEWETILAGKDAKLKKCQEQIANLEGQLKAVEQNSNRVTFVKMKKELESREAELQAVQKELSEATAHLTSVTSQLEQMQGRGDTGLVNSALKQELEKAHTNMKLLENDLKVEVERREQAEAEKEERDEELTQALGRLGEYERGEYGLHEAVMEIKVKKEELAVRDKDIAELTQHANRLENELSQFEEENEALRERLGMGMDASVDVSAVKARRVSELERLQKESRMLENQVERLEEEKLNLRKQLLDLAINKKSPAHLVHEDSAGTFSHTTSGLELECKVQELEQACREEKHEKETWQGEAEVTKGKLKQAQEKVKQLKVVVKELKEAQDKKQSHLVKSEALHRLIALLEVEGSGGDVSLVLQLKSQLSEKIGQNEVLSQQVQQLEAGHHHALRELERKQCELESLTKELVVLKKQHSGFQAIPLPTGISPSSGDVINSLNEQLLHALHQLHSREKALDEANAALERLQRKFAVIIHQQGVLYQEYKDGRSKWEEDGKRAKEEKEKLLAQREVDKLKAQQLESLQESLSGDEISLQRSLKEMSRKLTVVQVNEKVVVRKLQLLQEREAGLVKENSQLHHDRLLIEKAVTEKLAYLQRHKEMSLFKLSSLQQQLSESVSCAEIDRANQQYNELAFKYQQLLNQQTSYTATAASVDQLQSELRTVKQQLEEVKEELALEKQKHRLMEAMTGADGKPAKMESQVQNQLATMEMQVLNERQKSELANVRWQQLQSVVAQLEQRNKALEDKFSDMTQHLLQAQVKEGELRDQLSSCLPMSEKDTLEQVIHRLKKSEAELKIENSNLKEIAEIARQQAIAMEMVQKSHDLEVSSLRQQLLDLQGASDERAAVGRLHHQMLALQVSEASALKRLEEAQAKNIKLEAALLRAEQSRAKESEMVFQARAEAANRVKHLRATIQSLRRQCSGCVPLSEAEQHAKLVQKAREDQREAEMLKESARSDAFQAQSKLLELEAQQVNLEELLTTLRDSTPGSSAARLTEWHAKLGELRLVELRLNRANQQLNDRVKHLEDVLGTTEQSCTKLEQDLVSLTKDYETSQLSWEQREALLEKQLEAVTRTSGVGDAASNSQAMLTSSGQLQDALLQLRDASKEKALLIQQLEQKEREVQHLEQALSRLREGVMEKENQIMQLKEVVERNKKASQNESSDREESERALKSAVESLKQLKVELSMKEQLAEKYQQMLQDTRQDHQREISAYRDETATLREKLNQQADSAFSRLKQAALEAANVSTPVTPTDRQLERLLELEDLTVQQQQEVKRLRMEVDAKKQQRDNCEQAYEARIAKIKQESRELTHQYKHEMEELRGSLSERSSRVIELEQEVEVLEGELSAAQQAAKQAPSRTMKALVERLRNQLSVKEKQQRALSQALLQVRADLVETAQKTLEGEAGKDEVEANVHHLVGQKTQELQQQVVYLSSRLDEVKAELSAKESCEASISQELEKAKADQEERETQMKTMEAELAKKRKALEQTRAREDKLINRLQHMETEIENSPQVVELQKRVKVLQGKLDKQKEQTKVLGESLKARQKPDPSDGGVKGASAGAKVSEGGAGSASAAIDSKHQAVQVVRWEEGKKWQKKLDTIKGKLAEKTREVDALQKQVTSLRELQSRNDREKSLLNSKVKSLQKQLSESTEHAAPETSRDGASHSVAELEKVINAMKKVIEKLQIENENLKRSQGTFRPGQGKAEAGKKTAALQEENTKLKEELKTLQQSMESTEQSSSKFLHDKIVAENERLVRDYKKEVSKNEKLQVSLSKLQVQYEGLSSEVDRINKSASGARVAASPPGMSQLGLSSSKNSQALLPPSGSPQRVKWQGQHRGGDGAGGRNELEVRVEELQAEVEKKTTMLMEVKRLLKEAAEREREFKNLSTDTQLSERLSSVVKERDTLKQETVQLRKELNAFDPSFFEEIEDLKFNYQEALKRNAELEEQLSHREGHSAYK